MDCIFKSFSIVVLNVFFILLITSISSGKTHMGQIYKGPNNLSILLKGTNEHSVTQRQEPNGGSGELTDGLLDATAEEPHGTTAEESHDATADESGATAEEPHGTTAEESHDATAEEPHGSTAEEPFGSTAEEPLGATAEEPHGTTAEETQEPNGRSSNLSDGSNGITVKKPKTAVKNKNRYVELNTNDNKTVIAKLAEKAIPPEDKDLDESASNEKLPKTDTGKPTKEDKLASNSHDVDQSHEELDRSESVSSDSENKKSKDSDDNNEERERYKEELRRGNKAEYYGTNPHYYQPDMYPELNRRFVPNYSYKEDEVINLANKDANPTNLEPKLASPDLVLAVAKESALIDAATPKNPSEHLIQKQSLRSGNYWNGVWKEEVKPSVLRSNPKTPLGVIPVKIKPGSNLYDLVTKLKQISPRLLYVINKKIEY